MRSELLQTESDTLLLLIEVEDNNVDLLVELYYLVRIVYAAPREVCDVNQSVNTTEVNEYTIRSDVLNNTLEDLTLLQLADDLLLLGLELSLDESLVRNNYVAELLVDLNNLELHGLTNELVVVAYGMNVDLATGQECLDAKYINNHTALSAALDVTLNNLLSLQSSVNALPALRHAGFLVAQYELAFLVLSVLNVNLNNVTGFQLGVVTELASGDDTIALVADVYNYLFLVNADNGTIDNLMLADLVKGLVISLVELFLADVCSRAILKLIPVEVL